MQKWEHLVVQLSLNSTVSHINGVLVGKEVKGRYGPEYIGESLFDFMRRIGYEGWELVGTQGVAESQWMHYLFFKRPVL